VTAIMTTVHVTVSGPTSIRNLGHRLYTDNFFLPCLVNNLHMKAINCSGTVRPDLELMLRDTGRKLRRKRGDIKARVKGELADVLWKDT
jgi:hypothetical protein